MQSRLKRILVYFSRMPEKRSDNSHLQVCLISCERKTVEGEIRQFLYIFHILVVTIYASGVIRLLYLLLFLIIRPGREIIKVVAKLSGAAKVINKIC